MPSHRLDGIHGQHRRTHRARGAQHDVEVAPGREPDVVDRDAEPPRARRDLGPRLLTGDQQAPRAAGGEGTEQMEHEGGLPDPGRAGQHDHGSGNEAATEDAVHAGHGRPDPRFILPSVQGHRSDVITSTADLDSSGLIHRPPRGTSWAPSRPLGQPLSARRTDERDPIPRHAAQRTARLRHGTAPWAVDNGPCHTRTVGSGDRPGEVQRSSSSPKWRQATPGARPGA